MGDVEISINEEGVLKVRQHYDLRVLLRHLRQEGFERPRVVRRPNCGCAPGRPSPDVKFTRILAVAFVVVLCLAGISFLILEQNFTHGRPPNEFSTWDYIFNRTWLFGHFEIGQIGIVLLAMFAAVLAIGVLAKSSAKKTGSTAQRRVQVQTISALVQQV